MNNDSKKSPNKEEISLIHIYEDINYEDYEDINLEDSIVI